MIRSVLFNQEQVKWIVSNYGPYGRKELTKKFNTVFGTNISLTQMISFVKNNRINSGRTGHFPKGNVPWCTGTKGLCKPNSGSFAKGHIPHNHQPVGTERINGDGYQDVKIADPSVWRAKHILLWEEANGPLPKGHNVRFIDGDKNNICLSNLIEVSDSEHIFMNINELSKQPPELRESVIALSRLQSKTATLEKGLKND